MEKIAKAFNLSLIAGILIISNAVLLGVVAKWFPEIIPTFPGSANNATVPFVALTAIGLLCGAVVFIGAIMLRAKPLKRKACGIITIVFSIPTVIMGGGFIVGFIMGIIGGAYALPRQTKMQASKPKTSFIKMTDSSNILKLEGAGPKIMLPFFLMFVITTLISYAYQPMFNYSLPGEWTIGLGTLFLAIGIPFWLIAVAMFLRAWSYEQLETRGPFAIMPNPIYSSFIVFVIPAISLLLNWWPILLTSTVMYAAQRISIHEEDDTLKQKFGSQYEEYRKKVLIKYL